VRRNVALKYSAVVAVLAAPMLSHAALDITAATASIGDVQTAVLAIGALIFGLVVAIKTWKWARRAL